MSVTTTNLVQGPGTLYSGAFGVTEPADTAVASPPGAGWTDVGGTSDGVTITKNKEIVELTVDQVMDVPGRRQVKRDVVVSTNLAEPTLENLALAENGGTITTGAGFKSYEPLDGVTAFQPTYKALLFDGPGPGEFPSRFIMRKALQTGNTEFAYKKDAQTVFTVQFAAHYVSSSIRPYKWVYGI